MQYLKNRNLIIITIVLVLLVGGYYVTNSGEKASDNKTTQSEQVKLDESGENKTEENKTSEPTSVVSKNVVLTIPAENASLTTNPTEVSLKVDKALTAGSEIKVVSDKNVDVVTAGNKLSTDLKTLRAPVAVSVKGTYTVSYSLNWAAGGSTTGSYKFTVK